MDRRSRRASIPSEAREAAPEAKLVVSQVEAINRCLLSRAELRAFASTQGLDNKLDVPEVGETLAA